MMYSDSRKGSAYEHNRNARRFQGTLNFLVPLVTRLNAHVVRPQLQFDVPVAEERSQHLPGRFFHSSSLWL